jgi:hypothetical protein
VTAIAAGRVVVAAHCFPGHGWTGVGSDDVPAIGWQIMRDRADLAYLADPAAFREPTEDELKVYAERRADPASYALPWLYEPYRAPDFRPVPPVHVTPVPPVSQPVTASGEIVPASGPVADATRDRLAAEAADADAAQKAAQESLSRWGGGKQAPDETQVMPVADTPTELVPVVTDEEAGK